MNPITLDPSGPQDYPLGDVQCSRTRRPPPPTAERRATELEVWQETDWVGLRFVRCEAEGDAAAAAAPKAA